jgi:hypothetical protein
MFVIIPLMLYICFMSDFSRERFPEDADVWVEVMDWEKAFAPQVIGTQGLGPCVGVAIYNAKLREGYVGHFAGHPAEAITVEEMVNEALLETSSPTELKAWVRGGSPDPGLDGDYKDSKAIRVEITELFPKLGLIDVDIEWADSSDSSVDLVLDCSTGAFRSVEGYLEGFSEQDDF